MYLLTRLLSKIIRVGTLAVTGPDGKTHRFGEHPIEPLHITVRDYRVARKIGLNPALGAGEAFMDGGLIVENDDIMALLDLIASNVRWDRDNPTRVALWKAQRLVSRFQQLNDGLRSKKNVAHHYDLDDRLYDLFLDP